MTVPMEDQPRFLDAPELRIARKLFLTAGFVMASAVIVSNMEEPAGPVTPVEPAPEVTTTIPAPIVEPIDGDPSYTG